MDKSVRLTAPQIELLTDIATSPQMYLRNYSRWWQTGQALSRRGFATLQTIEGNQTQITITEAGRIEARRREIIQ